MCSSFIRVGHLNTRSILTNFFEFRDIISISKYDIFACTETWLNANITNESIHIPGYKLYRRDRIGRGGGVCLYISDRFQCKEIDFVVNEHFEQLWITITIDKIKLAIGVIYRPPSGSSQIFLNSIEESLSIIYPQYDHIIMMGDFNTNLLNLTSYVNDFNTFLDGVGLKQVVQEPTRITENNVSLLDLIIVDQELEISNVNVVDASIISDHCRVTCDIQLSTKKINPTYHTFRDFSTFNLEQFESELKSIPWNNIYLLETIDEKVNFFNNNLLLLINFHAPLKTVKSKKSASPWLTDNIRKLMGLRDNALKKFKRSKNALDWSTYKNYRNLINNTIKQEKKEYFNKKLSNADIKEKWKILNNLNIKKKNTIFNFPDNISLNSLNSFFTNNSLNQNTNLDILNFYKNNTKIHFPDTFKFETITDYDISKILLGIKTKAVGSDELSLDTILLACPFVIPYITHLVNFCLINSTFPSQWKEGRVVPIPKNATPNEHKDFRPITILPVLSKIIERIVDSQLRKHLNKYNLLPINQSGFRPNHSCGTALLNITDDIIASLDNQKAVALILLDFSKAFDMICHDILFAILHFLGIDESAIIFFKNYFTNRSQRVVKDGVVSDKCLITSGVAQGSIVGPLIYTMYTTHFFSIIKKCQMHMYADDTQLYYSFDPSDTEKAGHLINEELQALVNMSKDHNLLLNTAKSSVMLFCSETNINNVQERLTVKLENEQLHFVPHAKNLGVILDNKLRFTLHISKLLQKSYATLKVLYQYRQVLSTDIKSTLCDTLVLSQFNFCDFLYGPCLSSLDSQRIQRMQNACLRLIHGIRKYDRISHTLQALNWLNMSNRRLMHTYVIFYKIFKQQCPPYLHNKLTFRSDVHNINIRQKDCLSIPRYRTTFFQRSFTYNVAKYLNNISSANKDISLNSFKFRIRKELLSKQMIGINVDSSTKLI